MPGTLSMRSSASPLERGSESPSREPRAWRTFASELLESPKNSINPMRGTCTRETGGRVVRPVDCGQAIGARASRQRTGEYRVNAFLAFFIDAAGAGSATPNRRRTKLALKAERAPFCRASLAAPLWSRFKDD